MVLGRSALIRQCAVYSNGSKAHASAQRLRCVESKIQMNNSTSNLMTLETFSRLLREKGVVRLFFKQLAPNDNSKNQIYLGGELSVLTVLPSGALTEGISSSGKPGAVGKQRLKAALPMFWLDSIGGIHSAPNAQLILYPQYPEVRLSGFLAGSTIQLGEWFDPYKKGRQPGRMLILGVARDGRIYAHLALPDSVLARQMRGATALSVFGALTEVLFDDDDGSHELMGELCRIHKLGWIAGKQLDSAHAVWPCNSSNCGGYTLEAELGITKNGYAEPDFRGWEVKSFSVANFELLNSQVITLMTPEPDGGIYKKEGVESFIRKFGYPDMKGRPDRLNFGGVHVFGRRHERTNLELQLINYDVESGKIKDVNGGIALISPDDKCAALWTFTKLINHWKKKHDKAIYVPLKGEVGPPRRYRYGANALLGRGADFDNLLKAFVAGNVYYDPGLKLECASGDSPKSKRRNQFRVKVRDLRSLYRTFEQSDVCI